MQTFTKSIDQSNTISKFQDLVELNNSVMNRLDSLQLHAVNDSTLLKENASLLKENASLITKIDSLENALEASKSISGAFNTLSEAISTNPNLEHGIITVVFGLGLWIGAIVIANVIKKNQ